MSVAAGGPGLRFRNVFVHTSPGPQERARGDYRMFSRLRSRLRVHLRQELDVLSVDELVFFILAPGKHAQFPIAAASLDLQIW